MYEVSSLLAGKMLPNSMKIAKLTDWGILVENDTRAREINMPRTRRVSGIFISQVECHFQLI